MQDCHTAIASIQPTSTIAELTGITKTIANVLDKSTTPDEIGSCITLFQKTLDHLAAVGNNNALENADQDLGTETFVTEQLTSLSSKYSLPLESHIDECSQLDIGAKKAYNKRAIMAVGISVLQRTCANAFLSLLCDRCESVGGVSLTYSEKWPGGDPIRPRQRVRYAGRGGPPSNAHGCCACRCSR
jgi:hypothetical protein